MSAPAVGAARRLPGAVPPGIRIYAVGDIHGRSDLLAEMIDRIDSDRRRRPVAQALEIYLGDYIDRGPDSKGVIDQLAVRIVRNGAICLRGNHESILERALVDSSVLPHWSQLGGLQTLASYGLSLNDADEHTMRAALQTFRRVLPQTHALFLRCLRNLYSCGDFLFVHAGIRPGVPLDLQQQHDLLWIRDEFLTSTRQHGKIVVHGHTPVSFPEIRNNRINIDTGAWHSGVLTCVAIEASTLLIL
jgi:serine/threonine protein phosphatase 1